MKPIAAIALLTALLFIPACGTGDDDTAPAGAPVDSAGIPTAPAAGGELSSRVSMHLDMMRGMSEDSVQPLLAEHDRLMRELIADMERLRRAGTVPASDAFTATLDSVRRDMAALQALDPSQLQAAMPGHHGRVMRLLEMREDAAASGRS